MTEYQPHNNKIIKFPDFERKDEPKIITVPIGTFEPLVSSVSEEAKIEQQPAESGEKDTTPRFKLTAETTREELIEYLNKTPHYPQDIKDRMLEKFSNLQQMMRRNSENKNTDEGFGV